MSNLIKDFNRILEYINTFYVHYSKLSEDQTYDFCFYLKVRIEDLSKLDKLRQKKELDLLIEKLIKKILQFILYSNLIILKAESSTSIRHYFPKNLNNYTSYIFNLEKGKRKIEKPFNGVEFFSLLKKYLCHNKVNVKINKTKNVEEILFFSINDYESIIRLLSFWDNSGKFINKVSEWETILDETWSFKFPNEKIVEIREIFNKFDAYLYFDKKFIEQIFGEDGLIKKNNLKITDFLKSVSPISTITRQAVYRWKNKNYLPLSFLVELMKTNYSFDRDFFKYIKSLQIGKSSTKISEQLVRNIKENYGNWFINFFPPPPSTKLGFIFDYDPLLRDIQIDFSKKYNIFLEKYSKEFLDDHNKVITQIKKKISKHYDEVYLKSLKLRNFKSFLNETIDFQRGINILWGLNESGKTTILDAIFFVLFIHKPLKHNYRLRKLYPLKLDYLDTHFIHFGKDQCEVTLVLGGEKGDIEIIRKLWKDGTQEIYINNENIIEKVNIRDFDLNIYESNYKEGFKIKSSSIVNKISDLTSLVKKKIKYVDGMDDFLSEKGGIKFEIANIIDEIVIVVETFESELIFDNNVAGRYINYVVGEIRNIYKEYQCFFDVRDIYPSFFLEFESVSNVVNEPHKMLEFYLGDINLEFLESQYSVKKINENTSDLMDFLKESKEFLYNLFIDFANKRLKDFSKEYFKKMIFFISLEDYLPTILCIINKESYPIKILSGGERSKLILGLLSILTSISNKSSFFLIDEPNEYLDQVNTEIIKKLFIKLFKNKQLVIATHSESYKNFQPAVIYKSWKDKYYTSHVFRVGKEKKMFDLISNLLMKYKELKENSEKEKEIVILFGELLDNQHEVLINNGFKVLHNGDTIKDKNYMVHLTRKHQNNIIHQFLIRQLDKGRKKQPDEVFHSRGYPDYQKKLSNIKVLTNFIQYVKSKK